MSPRVYIATETCRHSEGPRHDCAYVTARDRLIPAAELEAQRAVAHLPVGPGRDQAGARAFMDAMARLAVERGIASPGPTMEQVTARAAERTRRMEGN
jgi:hypothetical protein